MTNTRSLIIEDEGGDNFRLSAEEQDAHRVLTLHRQGTVSVYLDADDVAEMVQFARTEMTRWQADNSKLEDPLPTRDVSYEQCDAVHHTRGLRCVLHADHVRYSPGKGHMTMWGGSW